MNHTDQNAEILLERIEQEPKLGEIAKVTILAKNSKGIYVDINKTYEGHISIQELGKRSLESFEIGELLESYVLAADKNLDGCYRLSIKQIENESKWQELESLKNQNLELKITKVLKSGIEVEIETTGQIGFIPYGYLENKQEALKDTNKEDWVNKKIPGRIHELEKSKNKIILNNKVICDELRKNKANEVLNSLALGQTIEGEVVRIADFGVFVDLGGLDALIPSSELSWRRFKKPSDVVKVGDKIETKVFKIEIDKQRVALSVKQAQPDPWTVLPEEIKVGYQKFKAKVISTADFGAFVEIIPGIEALLHKSNFDDDKTPELDEDIDVEIINIEAAKRRMGVKIISKTSLEMPEELDQQIEEKELEHVK
jgi:ribosomal protein S1